MGLAVQGQAVAPSVGSRFGVRRFAGEMPYRLQGHSLEGRRLDVDLSLDLRDLGVPQGTSCVRWLAERETYTLGCAQECEGQGKGASARAVVEC
jgi:hypothetical protein